MTCDKAVNMAVRMAELHCVKHGIWWCSIFYVGVGCPFIIRVENNLSQMRSSPMLSMERIVPLSVSTLSLSLNHQVYSSGPNFMFGKIVKPFYPSNLNSNWKIARGSIVKPEKTIHLKLLATQILT